MTRLSNEIWLDGGGGAKEKPMEGRFEKIFRKEGTFLEGLRQKEQTQPRAVENNKK